MRPSSLPLIWKPSPAIWITSRTELLLNPTANPAPTIALVPHYTDFHGSTIFGNHNLRNHSPVQEIDELNTLSRLMKAAMTWQIDILQVRTHQLVFIDWG